MTSKMIVIPYERYMNLIDSHKNDIAKENVENNELQDSPKNNNVTQNLENKRVIELEKETDEKNNILNQDNMLSDNDISDFIPISYQRRCRLILNHMKKNNMKWDSNGRLILGEDCILNTHIVDLIRNGIGKYKKDKMPESSQYFIKLLLATHCPESILNQSVCQDDKNNKS